MTQTQSRLVRIGEAALATSLTPRAIRYYEELGLLEPAAHAAGGNRRYDEDDLDRLHLIKRLRDAVGMSLSELQLYLELENTRRCLSQRYNATSDPGEQGQLLAAAETVLRRRVALLEQKVARVQDLLQEESARLDKLHRLQASHRSSSNRTSLHDSREFR